MGQMIGVPDPEDDCGLLQFASSYTTKHFCRRTTGEVRKTTSPPQMTTARTGRPEEKRAKLEKHCLNEISTTKGD